MSTPLLTLSVADSVARVAGELAATPQALERARTRALAKLQTWVQRQVLVAASDATGVPQKTFKTLLRFRATRTGGGALSLWLGTNPIAAHHLGTVRWSRRMTGARAGRRLFPGAWAWSAPAQTAGLIMQRQGRARLPIQKVTVPIHAPVAARVQALLPALADRFERLLAQELRYALHLESAA